MHITHLIRLGWILDWFLYGLGCSWVSGTGLWIVSPLCLSLPKWTGGYQLCYHKIVSGLGI